MDLRSEVPARTGRFELRFLGTRGEIKFIHVGTGITARCPFGTMMPLSFEVRTPVGGGDKRLLMIPVPPERHTARAD